MTTEELRNSLLNTNKNGYTRITAEQKAEMNTYCKVTCKLLSLNTCA